MDSPEVSDSLAPQSALSTMCKSYPASSSVLPATLESQESMAAPRVMLQLAFHILRCYGAPVFRRGPQNPCLWHTASRCPRPHTCGKELLHLTCYIVTCRWQGACRLSFSAVEPRACGAVEVPCCC